MGQGHNHLLQVQEDRCGGRQDRKGGQFETVPFWKPDSFWEGQSLICAVGSSLGHQEEGCLTEAGGGDQLAHSCNNREEVTRASPRPVTMEMKSVKWRIQGSYS